MATITVAGVDQCPFLDKYEGAKTLYRQQGDWKLDDGHNPGRSDRIYNDTGGHYVIHDMGMQRRIVIRTEGTRSLVIWNPGQQQALTLDDIGPQWKEFVCVETANAGPGVVHVAPQQRHLLVHDIRLEPLA